MPLGRLVLQELVVCRTATEPRRKRLFEDLHDVSVQEGHAPGGELLEAPDGSEVRRPAAAAPARQPHCRRVRMARSPVEALINSRGAVGRIAVTSSALRRERPPGSTASGWITAWRSSYTWTSSETSGARQPAAMTPDSIVAYRVHGFGAGLTDARRASRGERLAAHPDARATKVDSGGERGLGKTYRRGRVGEQVRSAAGPQHGGHPPHDRQRDRRARRGPDAGSAGPPSGWPQHIVRKLQR